MRSQQALGRPGTAVIPRAWEQTHGQVIAKTGNACVSLRKPGSTTVRNPATKEQEYQPLTPYATGLSARIQAKPTTSDPSAQQAEETVVAVGYLITLSRCEDLDIAVGHLVDVDASTDHLANGRTFRIVELPVGSLRFERDLICTLTDQGGQLP